MSQSGHILVAEDDPTDAFFLQRAFKRAGIPVVLHFVRDGQEAIEYLEGSGPFSDRTVYAEPSLLLLDLKMPRLDGFGVMNWVRQRPQFDTLLVVLFSSTEEPKDIERAYALGANWHLVKPHSMAELTELVGRFKKYWLANGAEGARAAA